jgi:hypothetical protein
LDDALANPVYAEAIKQAERDLPDDKWMTTPFRANQSRAGRVYSVGTNILAGVEPILKQITAIPQKTGKKCWLDDLNLPQGRHEKQTIQANTMPV